MRRSQGERQSVVAAATRLPVATWLVLLAPVALVAAYTTSATVTFWTIGVLASVGAAVITLAGDEATAQRDEAAPDDAMLTPPAVIEAVASREVLRARRYERPLTAVSVALDVAVPAAGPEDQAQVAELASRLAAVLRDTDYVAHVDATRLLLLLTETTGHDARAFTNRLLRDLDVDVVERLRLGFATFPDDEVTWVALRERVVEDERPVELAFASADQDKGSDDADRSSGGDGDGGAATKPVASRARHGGRPLVRAARVGGGVIRRVIDVAFVLAVAPFVVPVLVLAALATGLESPGPALIRHVRVGRGGKPIALLKLRTMVANAEELKAQLGHLNMLAWPDFKIDRDPRITRVGWLLRRTSLDELPQLWNVLRGELTLIGPRPCSVGIDRYQLWQTERLEATPGLFGRWQAEGRASVTFDERCRMDIRQVRQRSLPEDLRLAVASIRSVLTGRGAG